MIYVNVCVIIAMIPLTVQNDIEYITQHVTINIWLVRIGFWPFISCCIHVQMHFVQKICSVCVYIAVIYRVLYSNGGGMARQSTADRTS